MTATTQATAIENSTDIAQMLQYMSQRIMPSPGAIPKLKNIDMGGMTVPYNGTAGGDLLSWVNFAERYDVDARIAAHKARPERDEDVLRNLQRLKRKGGILLADVAGHDMTDTVRALMMYQAFHTGALYELDDHGEITTRLFEHINTRFCKSTTARNLAAEADATKFITMIYGEISEKGRFRFISAGHPEPLIFSRQYDKFMDISPDRKKGFLPIGMQVTEDHPDRKKYSTLGSYKKKYTVNELNIMGLGDILLMYSDGLLDAADQAYSKERLERVVSEGRNLSSQELSAKIIEDRYRVGPRTDDLSLAVMKYG